MCDLWDMPVYSLLLGPHLNTYSEENKWDKRDGELARSPGVHFSYTVNGLAHEFSNRLRFQSLITWNMKSSNAKRIQVSHMTPLRSTWCQCKPARWTYACIGLAYATDRYAKPLFYIQSVYWPKSPTSSFVATSTSVIESAEGHTKATTSCLPSHSLMSTQSTNYPAEGGQAPPLFIFFLSSFSNHQILDVLKAFIQLWSCANVQLGNKKSDILFVITLFSPILLQQHQILFQTGPQGTLEG